MGFPLKIGDKVVYTHYHDPDPEWQNSVVLKGEFFSSDPVSAVHGDLVSSFCCALEDKVRPVEWFFFILRTDLLCLIRGIDK